MAPLDGRWAPSRYHKELQRAIAFRSFISIIRSGVRKKQTQESILERLFHKGETNEHGEHVQEALLDQVIKGTGQFAGLCDRHTFSTIDDTTGERKEETRLVLKDCFIRTLSVRFVIGESFTRESLSLAKLSHNKKLVTGRTLRAAAELAHMNGTKAYEFAVGFLDKNMQLPPGKTMEDYDTYILTMMWKYRAVLNNEAAVNDSESPKPAAAQKSNIIQNGNNVASTPPNDWIFEGWFAFRLFGPLVDERMLEYRTDSYAHPPEGLQYYGTDDMEQPNVKPSGPTSGLRGSTATVDLTVGEHGAATSNIAATTAPFSTSASAALEAAALASRKRLMRVPPGPFASHLSDEAKRYTLDTILQRVAARERLLQEEINSLHKKAESLSKTMEMEMKFALAVAPNNSKHESWKEYRRLREELNLVWIDIETKHKETKQRDADDSEVVNEYLSVSTTKKCRYDPKPLT